MFLPIDLQLISGFRIKKKIGKIPNNAMCKTTLKVYSHAANHCRNICY